MKLSVVMPVYNERRTISQIIEKIAAIKLSGITKEIVVVDDFSTDGTREALAGIKGKTDIKIIYHEKNQGKGSAVRTGLQHATGDIIIFQDADSEYDPADYEKLIQPIREGRAEVVYGSRFMGKSIKELGNGKWILPTHFIGNKILTLLTNILYGQNLTDMETGYKVFKADIIKSLNFKANRFDMEPEITTKLLKMHTRIYEVPIKYAARDFSQGKKITWKDGVKAAWCLLKFRFTR